MYDPEAIANTVCNRPLEDWSPAGCYVLAECGPW